jgi:hypothetical protein
MTAHPKRQINKTEATRMKLQGILCCAICFALPVFAQTSPNHSSNSQNNNDKPPVQNEAAQRSRWAVETLNYTQQARQALSSNNPSSAKQDVEQALNLISKIDNSKIKNTSSSSQQADRLVPIYTEFEQTSFLQPVLTAQHKTSKESSSDSEVAKNSSNSTLPQSDRPEAVTAVDQGYTLIALDTNAAKNDLQQAETDLNNNDSKDADQKLAAVQESVALASSEENRPLVRARENLGLADSAAENNNFSEARATLQAAATALDGYSQNGSAKHASDAKNLSQEIRTATRQSSRASSVSQKQIDSWWNQVADWTQASS